MWLLWFASCRNSVDFIGLFDTEEDANKELIDLRDCRRYEGGYLKISLIEKMKYEPFLEG